MDSPEMLKKADELKKLKMAKELKKLKIGVATRLDNALVRRGLSQEKASEKIDLSRDKIKHWLHPKEDNREIKAYDLFVLCKELDLSADWLLGLRPESGDDRVSAPATDDLGLSQNAIDTIKFLTTPGGMIRSDALLRLLEDKNILALFLGISNIMKWREEVEAYIDPYSGLPDDEEAPGYSEAYKLIESCGQTVIDKRELIEYELWSTAKQFEQFLEGIK